MARIARRIDDETLEREPSIFTVINSNSPLRLDTPMLHGIIEFSVPQPGRRHDAVHARRGDGAGHAGRRARAAERRSAGRHRADPDRAAGRAGRLRRVHVATSTCSPGRRRSARRSTCARRWSAASWPAATACPTASSNVCAANAVDAQAAYESVFSLWGAVMGGVNLLMHGAGWMEGGLHASFEKMVHRRRPAADGAPHPRPDRRRRRHAGHRRDRRGRPGRPLLRRRPHTGPLPHRLLQADDQRLAQLRELGGSRQPRGLRQGQPHRQAAPRRVRAAADGRRSPRGARRLRRAPVAEGGVATDYSMSPLESRTRRKGELSEVVGASRRDRRRRRRGQRALPPHQGRMDRRRAARAQASSPPAPRGTRPAACTRSTATPTSPALQQYTVNLYKEIEAESGPELQHPPARRADARRHPGAAGLAADGPGPRPLPRHAHGADHRDARPRRSIPLLEEQYFVGALYDPDEGTSTRTASPTPTRSAPATARRRGLQRHVGHRRCASAPTARGTCITDRRDDPRRARRQLPAGSGRARSGAWSASSCRCSPWSTSTSSPSHARGHRLQRGARARAAALIDFAGEIYIRQERPGHPARHVRAGQACRGRPTRRRGTSCSSCSTHDLDRIAPELESRFEHFPAIGDGRHPAVRQRTVHVQPRRQPARRSDPRHRATVGRVRGDGRAVAGRRRRPVARQLDDRRRPRHATSGAWTSPATATTPRSPYTNAKVRENYSPPVPDHVPQRGAAGRSPVAHHADLRPAHRRTTRCGVRGSGSSTRCGSRRPGWRRSRTSRSTARTRSIAVAEECARGARTGRADRDRRTSPSTG